VTRPSASPGAFRAVIVDDEALAREGIRLRLERTADFTVVGEFDSADGALTALPGLGPDVLFVDVQMPGVNGLELAERLQAAAIPAVVFVTAFDRYALEAFRVRALDYLVKPYDEERFAETLQRVRARVAEVRDGALGRHVRDAVGDAAGAGAAASALRRLPVPGPDGVTFVATETIDWIEAARDYVKVHVGGGVHLLRDTLTGVHARLDAARFVRIHRSAVVNLDRIVELQPYFHGDYIAVLRSGARLRVGRRWRDALARALGTRL